MNGKSTSYDLIGRGLGLKRIKCSFEAQTLVTPYQKVISDTYVVVFSFTEALISDRGYHSKDKVKATVNLMQDYIHANRKAGKKIRVIFLIADELQAHNKQAKNYEELQKLRNECHLAAVKWAADLDPYFKEYLPEEAATVEVQFWNNWIGGENTETFAATLANLAEKRVALGNFEEAIEDSIKPFLKAYIETYSKTLKGDEVSQKAQIKAEIARVSPFFKNVPAEETAVIQMMVQKYGPINIFYPTQLNAALLYLRHCWKQLTNDTSPRSTTPFESFEVNFKDVTKEARIARREDDDSPTSPRKHFSSDSSSSEDDSYETKHRKQAKKLTRARKIAVEVFAIMTDPAIPSQDKLRLRKAFEAGGDEFASQSPPKATESGPTALKNPGLTPTDVGSASQSPLVSSQSPPGDTTPLFVLPK